MNDTLNTTEVAQDEVLIENGPEPATPEVSIEDLKNQVKEKTSDISNKKYEVNFTRESLDNFETFFKSRITFKGKEAMGLIQLMERVNALKQNMIGNPGSKSTMSALELQAAHYFLNKFEGAGVHKAKELMTILLPIEEAIVQLSKDTQELQDLNKQLTALEQQIDLA